jgi:hypothetical protein
VVARSPHNLGLLNWRGGGGGLGFGGYGAYGYGGYGYLDAYGYYDDDDDDEDDGGCYLVPGSSACDDAIRLAHSARSGQRLKRAR